MYIFCLFLIFSLVSFYIHFCILLLSISMLYIFNYYDFKTAASPARRHGSVSFSFFLFSLQSLDYFL